MTSGKIGLYGAGAAAGFAISNMAIQNNTKPKLGVKNGRLKEMPSTPNAVSSQTTDRDKFVPAWPYNGSKEQAKKNLLGMLKGYEGVRIVQVNNDYVYAVATSTLMKYKDNIEFYFNDAAQQIEFRSASRVGYSDAGFNRKRYDEMKKRYSSISTHTRNS